MRMNRRSLLTGAAAMAAYGMLGGMTPARATTTGVIPCAIRWDAWYSQAGNPRIAQNTLNANQFHYRAPWFCTEPSSGKVDCTGVQASMDLEIQLAAQAGIKCFAFDCYLPTLVGGSNDAPMNTGWNLYNASSYKGLVKWCTIPGGAGVFGSPSNVWSSNDWQASCSWWIPYFAQSNYQTVTVGTSNRPLVYILWNAAHVASYFQGLLANVATAIAYLRTLCAAAGLGNPYVVVLATSGAAADATAIGADAISSYGPLVINTKLPNSYADLDTATQAFWGTLAASFATIVPDCITGWDRRPRYNMPETFAEGTLRTFRGNLQYYSTGTPTQIAAHIQAGINYIGANPTVCPSKALLIYSWSECTEGGTALIPTLGDPPINAESGQALNTSNLLKAVGPVLRAAA